MDTSQILSKFKDHVQVWRDTVDKYELSDLTKKPDESNWSLGQVCMHVILVHEKFYMMHIDKCFKKEGEKTRKGKNMMGRLIFFLKSIPPVKVKMPKSHAFEPPQPENKEQLHEHFNQMILSMEAVEKELATTDLEIKTKHPLLGMLNALEWYRGAEMHIRHHLLQKKRIEKFLEKAGSG